MGDVDRVACLCESERGEFLAIHLADQDIHLTTVKIKTSIARRVASIFANHFFDPALTAAPREAIAGDEPHAEFFQRVPTRHTFQTELQNFFKSFPGEGLRHCAAHRLRHAQKEIAAVERVVQRLDDRLTQTHAGVTESFHCVILIPLQKSWFGQNQIGVLRRLVHERRERNDERNLFESFDKTRAARHFINRIGVVEE